MDSQQDFPTPAGVSPSPIRAIDRRYVTAALMMVMVLASMEMTITATAMPSIIGDLHGLEHYSWVASVYLLTSTISMPLYGRLTDALGRKRVIVASIILFCGASILASTAQTMIQLVIYRGLQGLGAGGIMPVVLTILADIYTLQERAKIQGLFSAVWGSAALAGPWLGATLVVTLGWRSIFWVNLPFGIIALIVLMWKYHDQEKPHSTDLDLPGAATLAIGCTSILMLVSRLGPGGWSLNVSLLLIAVTILSAVYYLYHERRTANPILPLDLVFSKTIGPSVMGMMLLGVGFQSLDTYVPLYVQGGKGGGATAAAGVVTPVILTWALSGILSAPMTVRFGFRNTALLGASITVCGCSGLFLCAFFDTPRWVMTTVLALNGVGFGLASMSYVLSAQHSVTWQQRGVATGAVQFFRNIGGAIGIGVLGAFFNSLIHADFVKLEALGIMPSTLLDPNQREQIPAATLLTSQLAITSALTWVFAAMVITAVMQLILATMMQVQKSDAPVDAVDPL